MAVDQVSIAADLTAKIVAVNAEISTVGTLAVDSPIILSTVFTTVQSALVPFNNAIVAFDADIDITSVGGVITGPAGPVLAADLLNQASDVSQQGILVVARAFLSRVGTNIANAPG